MGHHLFRRLSILFRLMPTFKITNWQAWAPNIRDRSTWEDWARSPGVHRIASAGADNVPELAFLSAMQRRRLSPFARRVVDCAWPLSQTMSNMPVVFASRHGELSRSHALLQDLVSEQPLSPTAFGLSVHNALLGVWSILRGETIENVAIASRLDGLEHALLEAQLLLAQGHEGVLVIAAEAEPPPEYLEHLEDLPHPYVAAFLIQAGEPCSVTSTAPEASDIACELPHPMSLIRHLILATPSWRHAGPRCTWQWTQRS